jgi:hypothetical protein
MEPKVTKSNVDNEPSAPLQNRWWMLQAEPIRIVARSEVLLPMCIASRSELQLPTFAMANTETALPKRAYNRQDICDPRHAKSITDNDFPIWLAP